MDFSVSDKMQAIVGMMNEFVEKELIPLEPEFLGKSFREMVPVAGGEAAHGQTDGAVGAESSQGVWRYGPESCGARPGFRGPRAGAP